jgi:hypothetical protein
MVRFNHGGEGNLQGELRFRWDLDQTLDEALMANFPECYNISLRQPPNNQPTLRGTVTKRNDPSTPETRQVFSSLFTLRDIHTLGDFVIQPTDNILQHLSVEKFRGRKFRATVFIFFHASVLSHLRAPNLGYSGPISFSTFNYLFSRIFLMAFIIDISTNMLRLSKKHWQHSASSFLSAKKTAKSGSPNSGRVSEKVNWMASMPKREFNRARPERWQITNFGGLGC